MLLAPLPIGVCLLAVHRGIAGLVFLLGVPLAALYLAVVTQRCALRRRHVMPDRPRYMISVAAELVGMHPQTLRIYEQKGLVRPQRTAGNTRLYSDADVERLRVIQRLTNELGLNLAGVERVLVMEDELQRMRRRLERMEQEMRRALDEVHRTYRRDLVLYRPPQPRRASDGQRARTSWSHRDVGQHEGTWTSAS